MPSTMLALLPLLIATSATPCGGARYAAGNAVLLPGSSQSIVVPDGWWLRSRAVTSRPELSFQLPHECAGGVWTHPELEVSRLDDEERPSSLDDVGRLVREFGAELREAPARTTIAGHDAVDYTATGTLIAHRLGGGAASFRPLYYRVVVMQVDDEFFECRLTEGGIGTKTWDQAPRTLCASLAVRADAQPYVP
jgi:hypothetical protein